MEGTIAMAGRIEGIPERMSPEEAKEVLTLWMALGHRPTYGTPPIQKALEELVGLQERVEGARRMRQEEVSKQYTEFLQALDKKWPTVQDPAAATVLDSMPKFTPVINLPRGTGKTGIQLLERINGFLKAQLRSYTHPPSQRAYYELSQAIDEYLAKVSKPLDQPQLSVLERVSVYLADCLMYTSNDNRTAQTYPLYQAVMEALGRPPVPEDRFKELWKPYPGWVRTPSSDTQIEDD